MAGGAVVSAAPVKARNGTSGAGWLRNRSITGDDSPRSPGRSWASFRQLRSRFLTRYKNVHRVNMAPTRLWGAPVRVCVVHHRGPDVVARRVARLEPRATKPFPTGGYTSHESSLSRFIECEESKRATCKQMDATLWPVAMPTALALYNVACPPMLWPEIPAPAATSTCHTRGSGHAFIQPQLVHHRVAMILIS